jgi:hypothetical protein
MKLLCGIMLSGLLLSGPLWGQHWHDDEAHWKRHWQHEHDDDDGVTTTASGAAISSRTMSD